MTEQRQKAYNFLKQNGKVSGAQLAQALNIPDRTARRYVAEFVPPEVYKVPQWAVIDIETTDLTSTGRKGFMICCSVLPLDADRPRTHTLRFEENRGDEKRLLQVVINDLEDYDFIIGHFVNGFDINWLDTRRAIYNLPPMRKKHVFDTYQVAKSLAWLTGRRSLAWLCDAFNIPCIKTAIYPSAWNEIKSPDINVFYETLKEVVYHCEQDVLATRRLFYKLWPNSFNPPSPLKLWTRGNAPKV